MIIIFKWIPNKFWSFVVNETGLIQGPEARSEKHGDSLAVSTNGGKSLEWWATVHLSVRNVLHKLKQDRQCTYSNIEARSCNHCCSGKPMSVCICSLTYPAWNAHALHSHLWPALLYNIFPHFLVNGTILEKKKLLNTKCVFWSSLQHLSETFLILRRNERCMIKNVHWSSSKVHFIFVQF